MREVALLTWWLNVPHSPIIIIIIITIIIIIITIIIIIITIIIVIIKIKILMCVIHYINTHNININKNHV